MLRKKYPVLSYPSKALHPVIVRRPAKSEGDAEAPPSPDHTIYRAADRIEADPPFRNISARPLSR